MNFLSLCASMPGGYCQLKTNPLKPVVYPPARTKKTGKLAMLSFNRLWMRIVRACPNSR